MKLWIESSTPDHEVVTILGNREGLGELLACLQSLVVQDGTADDCHLFTPSYGGDDLAEETPREGSQVVHQLSVYLVDEDHPR
ncbi:MAG: hypothetical protein JOZ41_02740 [Chloroflexi bacterium]|nr:hypothetical protein [Chloroflexota bacterium]